MLILRIICGILLSFTIPGTAGSRENEDIWVERGQNALLKCPIKTENCGELHAVTWFKNEERLGMVLLPNGRKKVGYTEAFINKTIIDYTPKDPFSYLTINTTQIQDEDVYRCDRTYVAPSEKCEIAPYSFKLNVYVKPRATLVTDKNGKRVANNTRLGPFREGDTWNGICEVHETRPLPTVNWYKNNQLVQTRITPAENNSLFNVKSEYPLLMARDTLVSSTECRINLPGIDTPIVYQVKFDVQVRPTKIVLRAETKHKHFVEGDKVTLKCEVTGARPQANITWYNETTPLNPDGNHRTKITTEVTETPNGTFTTLSILTFNATMYESGKLITCAADNIVMRAKAEKSIHDRYDVEVLYPPVINSTPNEYILVNETNQIFLGCSYVSNPASLIAVRWFKNGQSLNLNHSRYKGGNSENPSLEINHSKRGDSGSYVCELTNAIGTTKAKHAIQVDVQYAPVVYLGMEPESPLIETAEANVTLNCSVLTGNPPILTKVRWFLEGALLKELPECNVNQTDDNEDLCNIDPSKLLLQNVGRDFLGNYSCEGYNDVGWGPRSDELPLVVYYAPGNATLTHVPDIPKKNEIVTFKCIVKARGLPVEHKYRFLRDGKVLMDNSTSSEFTVKADIYNRANFSCLAYNEGGEGYQGYDDLDIHVQPTFIDRMDPYTGIHYRSDNATLSCPVQCYPKCDVLWFKDNYGIEEKSPLYTITEEYLPPNYGTGDFETVVSRLTFNISAWPGGVLDIHKDNANYSCSSTNTTAGNGVRASTYVGIEYPPVNISVSDPEIQVVEGQLAEGVVCKAQAKPEPSFQWLFNDEVIVHGESLLLNNKTTKALGGNYYCRAYNKHGSETIATKMNVLYKPSCMITRTLIEEEDTLICTGEGNPPEITYAWSMKTENETSEIVTAKQVEQVSHLVLGDDFSSTREYFCFPNNSIGHGPFCKIEVLEKLPWYKKWNSQTMLIVVGSVLGVLLAAIIICIIICCVCRRRRRQNKYHTDVSASATQSVLSYKPSPAIPTTSATISPTCEIPKSPPKWPLRPGVMVHVRDDTKQNLCANRTTVKFTNNTSDRNKSQSSNNTSLTTSTPISDRNNSQRRNHVVRVDIETAPKESTQETLPRNSENNTKTKRDNHIENMSLEEDNRPPPLPKRRIPPINRSSICRDNSLGHSSNRLLPRKRKKHSHNLSSDNEDDDESFMGCRVLETENSDSQSHDKGNLFEKILSEIFNNQRNVEDQGQQRHNHRKMKTSTPRKQLRNLFGIANFFSRNSKNTKKWNPFATEHRLKGIRCSGGVVTYKKTPILERPTLVDKNSNTLDTTTGSTPKNETKSTTAELHGKSSALGDPLTEPGEYENLPFHGLQTAPNKFTTTPINYNNTNVVRVTPRPKLTKKNDQPLMQQKYPIQQQLHNNPSIKQIHHQQQQQQHQQQHQQQQQQQQQSFTTSSTSSQKLLPSSSNTTVSNKSGADNGGSSGCNTANYAIPNKSGAPNTTNHELGNCFPTSYTAYYHFQQKQTSTTNPPRPCGSFANNFPYTVENNIVVSNNSGSLNNPFSASNFKKFNTNTGCSQGIHRKKSDSDKKFYSLKSLSNKKGLHFYSMKQSLAAAASGGKCKRHHSFAGGNSSNQQHIDSKTLPNTHNRNKLNFYEPPLYENLTDSIQIHESDPTHHPPEGRKHPSGSCPPTQHPPQLDDFNNLIDPEHSTIYRSDSGISNSSYDCTTPIPSQRQGGPHHQHYNDKLSKNPVYMNLAGNTSSASNTTTSSLALPLTQVPNNNGMKNIPHDGYLPMTNSIHNDSTDKTNATANPSNNNPTNIHKDKHHHRHHHSKQSSGNRKCKKRSQNATSLANNECARDTNPFLASTSSSLSNYSGNSIGSMAMSTTSSSSSSQQQQQQHQTHVSKDSYPYNVASCSSTKSHQQLQQQQQQQMPIQPSSTIKTGTPSQIKNYNRSKCDNKHGFAISSNCNSDNSLTNMHIKHQKPNTYYTRPVKLPLRKHHSFHFQPPPPQTLPLKSKANHLKQNGGPLIYKPFMDDTSNSIGFRSISTTKGGSVNNSSLVASNSNDNSLVNAPRICGTVLKRHMSNVESFDSSRYIRSHSLSSPRLNTCITDEEDHEDEIDEIIITQEDDNASSSSNSTIVNQGSRLVYADLATISNNLDPRSNPNHSRNMSSATTNTTISSSIDDFDDLTINSDGEQFQRSTSKLRQSPYCGNRDFRRAHIIDIQNDQTTILGTPVKPKSQYSSMKFNEVNI